MPQVHRDTIHYVVSKDGTATMTFEGIVNAIKGGMEFDDVEIFTDEESARMAKIANYRRSQVDGFERSHVLRADSIALMANGQVIDKIDFIQMENTHIE